MGSARIFEFPFSALQTNAIIKTADEARELYERMMKEETLSKYQFPTEPCKSDGCYHIHVADPTKKSGRKDVKAKTIRELKEKVYAHEKGIAGAARKSFQEVFDLLEARKPTLAKTLADVESIRNSVKREQNLFKKYFAGTGLAKMYVDEIAKKDIEDFVEMTLKSNDVNPKAYLSIRGTIRQTLEFAFKNYWIDENPHFRADYNQFRRLLTEPAQIEDRVHSLDEIGRMTAYIRAEHEKSPKYMAPYALEFQMMIGAREGEIPPLRWIDIADSFIHIHREQLVVKKTAETGSSTLIVSHTKTRRDRKYPITNTVRDFLDRLQAVHEQYGIDSEYLFPSRDDPEKAIHNNSIYRYYAKMCRALDIEISREKRKGPHSFRRNAITQTLNNSGGNIVMTGKLYGNSGKVIDQHYYTGLDLDEAKRVLEMHAG